MTDASVDGRRRFRRPGETYDPTCVDCRAGGHSLTDAPGARQPVTHGGWVGYASSRPELSPRETSVAALVASGNTNAQIARLLGLSPQSVKNILNHIFAKLGISNRTQLALYMLRRHTDEKAITRRLLEYVAR